MLIRHTIREDALWIYCYNDNEQVLGSIKFCFDKNGTAWSASTYVNATARGQGIATRMYFYVHDLGYHIRPSVIQTPEGEAMWKAFRARKLPFVTKETIWQKIRRFLDL